MLPTLIADAHLGRLAKYLRLLGYDTAFERDIADRRMLYRASSEKRMLLSRDRALVEIALETGLAAILVQSSSSREQLQEVLARIGDTAGAQPFSRCLECNGDVVSVPKVEIRGQVPEPVFQDFDEYFRCGQCKRVYWKGSHYDRMREFIEAQRPR